jgi:hypothetical protein
MPQPFEPTPAQVKALIPTRLHGQPFSETTVPSEADVEALIADVAEDILDRLEVDEVDAEYLDRAKRAVIYETAARLELQFWPEQTGRRGQVSSAIYDQWHERAERVLDRLQQVLVSFDPDKPEHGAPAGFFPSPTVIPEERFEPLGQKGF